MRRYLPVHPGRGRRCGARDNNKLTNGKGFAGLNGQRFDACAKGQAGCAGGACSGGVDSGLRRCSGGSGLGTRNGHLQRDVIAGGLRIGLGRGGSACRCRCVVCIGFGIDRQLLQPI